MRPTGAPYVPPVTTLRPTAQTLAPTTATPDSVSGASPELPLGIVVQPSPSARRTKAWFTPFTIVCPTAIVPASPLATSSKRASPCWASTGTAVHDVPLPRYVRSVSLSGDRLENPTAHTAPAGSRLTDNRNVFSPASPTSAVVHVPCGVAEATSPRAYPSAPIDHPATTGAPSTIVTPCSTAASGGGGTTCHPSPARCRIEPCSRPPSRRSPTIQRSSGPVPSMAVKMRSVPRIAGVRTSVHDAPSQCSTSGSSPVKVPTAQTSSGANALTP